MTIWLWVGFVAFVLAMLGLDLGLFHRRAHVVTISEAVLWTSAWVLMALTFNVGIYLAYENHWLGIGLHVGHDLTGKQAALQFFTG